MTSIFSIPAPEAEREAYLMYEGHSTQIANHSKSTAFIGRRAGRIDCYGRAHIYHVAVKLASGKSGPHSLSNREMNGFFLQVHDQQRDLHLLQRQLGKANMECEELSQTPSLKGKVVYDENDPQRYVRKPHSW